MDYKTFLYNETQIMKLYSQNNWTSYTSDSETLFDGFRNSLYIYAAYDGDELVGLIRVVGDGFTIIYIQDIIVLPTHQLLGIGKTLTTHVLEKYSDVRQIVLTTIQSESHRLFYESLGFVRYDQLDLVGYYYKK